MLYNIYIAVIYARRRHPGLQSNADNIQGVLGEGTLGCKVMLIT